MATAAALTLLCLLPAALLGGAFSLKCFQCNTTGNNCEENEKTCESNFDTCMTTITVVRPDKSPAKSFKYLVKSCGEKKHCNQSYSMSFSSSSLYAAVKCCDGDRCKTEMPDIAKVPATETQFKCPSCYEPTLRCNSTVDIKCLGDENKCVSYTVKESFSDSNIYSWKGCATENLCTMKNLTTMPTKHILATQFQCNHGPSLLPGLLPAAILGLLMLKLLS